MQRQIQDGIGNDCGDKYRQNFHAGGGGHDQGRSEEKGLILPGGMQAQVGGCIQVTIIVERAC